MSMLSSTKVIDNSTTKTREDEYSRDDSIGSFMYFFQHKNKRFCVDATEETKYKGRLVNHSTIHSNLKTKVIEIGGKIHLILIANRVIEMNEELLYDYSDRSTTSVSMNPLLINS